MKKTTLTMLALLLGAGLSAYLIGQAGDDGQFQMPELPQPGTQTGVSLIAAQPFRLDAAATHFWRKEQPRYDAGYLLVLAVDRELVQPRQSYEPVLYVGDETAERVNLGHESGFVIAIIPGAAIDLASTPIFFGDAALPEEVDHATCVAQLASARRQGIAPQDAASLAQALRQAVEFENDYQLRLWAADLIEEFSPMEHDLITGLRAPLVGG